MSNFRCARRGLFAAVMGLALAPFQAAWAQVAPGTIADGDSIFIDGQTFKIAPGQAKPDAAAAIRNLGGRDLGPGVIIYRSGDQLYILGAPLTLDRGRSATPGPVADADKEQLGRVRIEYDAPKNPDHQKLYERLRRNRVLETIQEILSPFRLPNPGLLIKTLGCNGTINSWYNRDDPGDSGPTVHMCYELLDNIFKITSDEDVRPNVTRHDAIVGQFLFWTLHETGHAAFDIYQVPLFGREEDAADLFAAFIMLHFGKDQARRWIEGAAYTSDEFMADVPWGKNYASVHGLPQQRFYNLVCLAYGADPATFADVTENMAKMMTRMGVMPKQQQGVLPKQRAENCAYEFQTFEHAFGTQIRPHLDVAMAQKVLDTAWFPEPMHRRVRPSPTLAATNSPN
jgi:Putative metallopeptidase